jgi:hypothetical protein
LKKALLAMVIAFGTASAWAGGLAPWKFGMSHEQVSAFNAQGPYKSFLNGDLETYAGQFNGVDRNVQFYFNQSGLWRISVVFYEGSDAHAALADWKAAYAALTALYGRVVVNPKATQSAELNNFDNTADAAAYAVEAGAKVQMAPVQQPPEEFLFSSYQRSVMNGKTHYRVVVFLDATHANEAGVAQLASVGANRPAGAGPED